MIKFEVGETYVSHPDLKLYGVLRRTEKTVTVQDKTGHGYKKYLNARYTKCFQCEWIFIDSIISLNALDKYRS